jgi:DNA end-binding protein Ku
VEDFDFSKYKDPYTERVTELIEAKAAGKRITGRRKHEEPVVINLMEALRKSLDRAKHPVAAESNGSAHRRHARPGRRKKTG